MVAVLSRAGDHVPVMPLVEVAGNALNAEPEQMAGTAVNVGDIIGFTVTVNVTGIAHNPAVGAKV